MYKIEVSEVVRKQLLSLGFEDVDIDMLTASQVGLTQMISNAQEIDAVCFYTQAFNKHIVIDMNHAVVYRFPLDKYDMLPSFKDENILIREKGKDTWYILYQDKKLYPEPYKFACGFSYKGNTKYKYKSVQFYHKEYGETYKVNIKVHQIISAMLVEYDVLNASGYEATHAIHHKTEVRNGGGNGVDNLVVLDNLAHCQVHGKCI